MSKFFLPRTIPSDILALPETESKGGVVKIDSRGWISVHPDGTIEVIHEYANLDKLVFELSQRLPELVSRLHGYEGTLAAVSTPKSDDTPSADAVKTDSSIEVNPDVTPLDNVPTTAATEGTKPVEKGDVVSTTVTKELLDSLDIKELRKIADPLGVKDVSRDKLQAKIEEKLGLK